MKKQPLFKATNGEPVFEGDIVFTNERDSSGYYKKFTASGSLTELNQGAYLRDDFGAIYIIGDRKLWKSVEAVFRHDVVRLGTVTVAEISHILTQPEKSRLQHFEEIFNIAAKKLAAQVDEQYKSVDNENAKISS